MAVDKAQLRKHISEMLDAADLNTITAKKVRQQLEEKLDCDLSERRKEVDAIVMEVLDEKNDAKSDNEEDEESEEEVKPKKTATKRKSKKASDSDEGNDDDDYKPAKKGKGRKSKSAGSDSDDDWKKKPAKRGGAKGGAKKGGGTGYTKTCTLSPELASVMGEPSMARHEVVKRMWKLIKEKNLYDPKNKQFAICNEELLPVFGVKRFRTFGMMKYLKTHFTD